MMRRIGASRVGICQGSRILFSDFEEGGPMWSGAGPREIRHDVVFDDPPAVHVSLSMRDVDHHHTARMGLCAEAIRATGFTLVFWTWSDSRVARVRADWLAIGAVGHDDDRDVD